ncbi:FRG domain-containing protein [Flavobacterium sp. LB2P53]|uniref:FRG domain-containing protein n=1 Tax=Flavobacterium sp. LB2P53 TaxID=2497481 RepID=UPI000F842996|nr:FRG domain-containing protein [Flavobacterium sp. LB2P53]RTY70284.1 FRG domain-containing protein [Flavobacterium sp. LB2P53]
MKKFDINDYKDFENIISYASSGTLSWQYKPLFQPLYRGHSKDTYKLETGIARKVKSAKEIQELEANLIIDFKQLVTNISDYRNIIHLNNEILDYENDWRWLEQMQHFRIPTRLLDWSLEPEIALFFAVESEETEIGQFWIYKTPLNWNCDDHFPVNPYEENLNIISNSSSFLVKKYEDKIAMKRIAVQKGKFSIQDFNKCLIPLEEQTDLQDLLLKYTINPKSKKDLLEKLAEQNITKETVYVEFDNEIEKLIEGLKSKYNFKKS